MLIEIQSPNITAGSDREKLAQMQSYLYILARNLQWAFNALETGSASGNALDAPKSNSHALAKKLITEDQEIVNTYYSIISKRLTDANTVPWSDLGCAEGVAAPSESHGRCTEGGCHYRVSEKSHVYVAFNCSFTFSGETVQINLSAVPEKYRPKQPVHGLCIASDHLVALVSVTPEGQILVEQVHRLDNSESADTTDILWIDGYLDYWT